MKISSFWASVALLAPRALATTSASSTTSSAAAEATCTAFAVASYGRSYCWDYCNDHPPCAFVIFAAGNPYLGTGTCWLYPGETFDENKGDSDCANPWLSVYDKPECPTATTTTPGACAATETPSAIASVCNYPTPDEDCFYDCAASSGAVHCLSMCAERDSCNYVVYNPHNPINSPYASGTCWMYPNGTYDASAASECSGDPEQYVYNNVCPKPSPSSSSSVSSSSASSATEAASETTTAGATSGGTASAATETITTDENSSPAGLSLISPFAIGAVMLILQGL
ncbi:hypothetical protein BJY01DRAFT_234141 [Aspergillus pseudoustus]|uniref:Apple domain-containing protein n=1 Tax=Aspergillus pseudoustus TaxID=1810923 RepID=A0ABR4K9H0_9EURO